MQNMRSDIMSNSKIKFRPNQIDSLMDTIMSNSDNKLSVLSPADRALIYAMFWCNNEKSNREKYDARTLLSIAKDFYNFLI